MLLLQYGWRGTTALWTLWAHHKRLQLQDDLYRGLVLQTLYDVARPNYKDYSRPGWMEAVNKLRDTRKPAKVSDRRSVYQVADDIASKL